MQDKNSNIDKKFTQQAWVEMRKLLDREMPVAVVQRSAWKRYGLLLFLLIALGTAIGYVIIINNANKENPNNIETPIAEMSDFEKNETIQKSENEELVNVPLNMDIKSETAENINRGSKREAKNDRFKLADNINFGKDKPADNFILKREMDKGQIAKEEEKPIQKHENQISEIPPHKPIPSKKINSLPFLSLTSLDVDSHAKRNWTLPELLQPEKKSKRGPDVIKISAGMLFDPVNSLDGYSGTLAFDYHLKGERFGIETGLGYDFIKVNPFEETFNRSSSADNAPGPLIGLDETNPSANIGGHTVYLQKSENEDTTYLTLPIKLHSLKVPFELYYRINPKIKVQAGMNLALLLDAPSSTTGGILNNLNFSAQKDLAEEQGMGYSINARPTAIKKYDVGLGLGMSYFITPSLEVGAKYNFGLVDHLGLEKIKSHNRNFQLSLAYNFYPNK